MFRSDLSETRRKLLLGGYIRSNLKEEAKTNNCLIKECIDIIDSYYNGLLTVCNKNTWLCGSLWGIASTNDYTKMDSGVVIVPKWIQELQLDNKITLKITPNDLYDSGLRFGVLIYKKNKLPNLQELQKYVKEKIHSCLDLVDLQKMKQKSLLAHELICYELEYFSAYINMYFPDEQHGYWKNEFELTGGSKYTAGNVMEVTIVRTERIEEDTGWLQDKQIVYFKKNNKILTIRSKKPTKRFFRVWPHEQNYLLFCENRCSPVSVVSCKFEILD